MDEVRKVRRRLGCGSKRGQKKGVIRSFLDSDTSRLRLMDKREEMPEDAQEQ